MARDGCARIACRLYLSERSSAFRQETSILAPLIPLKRFVARQKNRVTGFMSMVHLVYGRVFRPNTRQWLADLKMRIPGLPTRISGQTLDMTAELFLFETAPRCGDPS